MDRRRLHPPSHQGHHPLRCQSNHLHSHYRIPPLHHSLLLQLVNQLPMPLIYPERKEISPVTTRRGSMKVWQTSSSASSLKSPRLTRLACLFSTANSLRVGHRSTQDTYIFASSADRSMPRIPLGGRKADEDSFALAWVGQLLRGGICPHIVLALWHSRSDDNSRQA